MLEDIRDRLSQSARLIDRFANDNAFALAKAVEIVVDACRKGGTVLVFGNGGSAADAQHIAGELVGRFFLERPAFRAVALTTDTSVLTAVANDYGFDHVFGRQVEALGQEGDVVIALSTSGSSANVIEGLKEARKRQMRTIVFTGAGGGNCRGLADVLLTAQSDLSPRIQEVHVAAYHVLCELVERELADSPGGE